ncbi:hypothetical protein OIU79_010995 [Salix purpurea]|uniref:Uncharacterized protein n=1 Tax=Salix purpurea TaxID=77065 RepID=A0A9Q0TAA6_SALPP|nr:hypothetical protein OIU79_010995 [Salix purpurea]
MADDGEKREIVVGLPNNHDKLFKIRKPPKPKPKAAEGEEMNVKKRKAAEGEEMNVKKKRRRRRILKEKVDEGEKGNDDLPEEGEDVVCRDACLSLKVNNQNTLASMEDFDLELDKMELVAAAAGYYYYNER